MNNDGADVAIISLKKIITEYPTWGEPSLLFGICVAQCEEYHRALKCFEHALTCGLHSQAMTELAQYCLAQAKVEYEQAQAIADATPEESPLKALSAAITRQESPMVAESENRERIHVQAPILIKAPKKPRKRRIATEKEIRDALAQSTSSNGEIPDEDAEGFRKNTLSQFPETYADGLWLLHCLHPKYRFEAYQTGLTFDEVLDNEDHVDRSLISATYNPNWVKPGSPVYDGTSWKAAKREVVQYFLDPRNFLTPDGIFQFEKLSFDETAHTTDGIKAMTKNSFLDAADPDYTSILLKAGRNAGVSPYFLASRILQEMGRNGESKLAHGTLPGYEGYYNFYNIGSTPNPSVKNGAQINGAKYAMYGSKPDEKQITPDEEALLLPWTDPDKAICGGALWIAKSYIEIGQNTLYFQKFDILDNDDGMYKHQYAQNIAMASNEAVRYYTAYASQDMLDSSFVFVIPVYEQMPAEYGKSPK